MGAVHAVSLKYVAFSAMSATAARWVMPIAIDELLFAEEQDLNGWLGSVAGETLWPFCGFLLVLACFLNTLIV